jgi:predicted Rossmann fold flavoprotein
MRNWLEEHGVPTKVEDDGRVFPSSNQSSSIIDCFKSETAKFDIEVLANSGIKSLSKSDDKWLIETDHEEYSSKNILIATGSNRPVWELLKGLGHQINSPVASLFAFTAADETWKSLAGISVQDVKVSLKKSDFSAEGPLLITHRGFSGPAVLKLSAWAARELEKRNYLFDVSVNWIGISSSECLSKLKALRDDEAKKNPAFLNPFDLPKRLNQFLFEKTEIKTIKMGEIGNKSLQKWADLLCNSEVSIEGKVTNKDEFVTCGGVDLQEVDPKNMESRILKGVFFAGEVLDIDAITGGFNFQACWSGANLAAKSMD